MLPRFLNNQQILLQMVKILNFSFYKILPTDLADVIGDFRAAEGHHADGDCVGDLGDGKCF